MKSRKHWLRNATSLFIHTLHKTVLQSFFVLKRAHILPLMPLQGGLKCNFVILRIKLDASQTRSERRAVSLP